MPSYVQSLLQFIDQSPTAFHAVQTLKDRLAPEGYTELTEDGSWELAPESKYYVTRADAAMVIFHTPKQWSGSSTFKIIGAHTDSPCLKVKSNAVSLKESYQLLNIEIYGGVLLTSWFDKDLLLGGRVFVEGADGTLSSELVQLKSKLRIPRLAIHLDREVNNQGFKVNPQEQMLPVMGLGAEFDFEAWIKTELKTPGKIMSWDLFLFDAEPCSFGGVNEEFIYAPRLDNLACVHASYESLVKANSSDDHFQIAAYFQHEEIGSTSQNGAGSNFMEAVLKRIVATYSTEQDQYFRTIANSFFISADMAHAVHPGYIGKHDANHKPKIGLGPVIKSNANMRYASDGFSIAKFKQWCAAANVPFQDFHTRNDMGCGSTIGPMTAAQLGIPTVDVGNAMLSMHSIREMAGVDDHDRIIRVFDAFYA